MEKNLDIYNKKEKCNIKAKIFYNGEKMDINHIFIFCHGYCSGKGSNSVKVVANKLLDYGIASISFDFPGHVDSVQGTDKLKVDVCISYIDSIIEYVKEKYGENVKISFHATSFGAYILLNKLIGDTSKYENVILRSPAINMSEVFVNCLLKESLEEYKTKGKAKTGHGGKLEVPYSFYESLVENNLYVKYHEKRKILIIQGDLDDTAKIKDTYRFIKDKPEIKLLEMKNMNHHLSPEEIEIATKEMIKKLSFNI